ncbi:MAG: hypothetical protein KDA91_01745 [Planctomycetaceae bacterium]|nr:hypothetical protein [Planctomycetaceae bacterium]
MTQTRTSSRSCSSYAVNKSGLMFQLIAYVLLTLGTGVLVGTSSFEASRIAVSLRLIFAAVLLLSVKRWTGTILLVFIQIDLFSSESRQLGGGMGYLVSDMLVLSLILFVSRYRLLRQTTSSGLMAMLRSLWFDEPEPSNSPRASNTSASEQSAAASAIGRSALSAGFGLTRLLVACVAAVVILMILPPSAGRDEWLVNSSGNSVFLWPGPFLLTCLLGLLILLTEITWRQQTESQSSQYARSAFLKAHNPDLRRIVVRRLKLLTKRRPKAKVSDNAES